VVDGRLVLTTRPSGFYWTFALSIVTPSGATGPCPLQPLVHMGLSNAPTSVGTVGPQPTPQGSIGFAEALPEPSIPTRIGGHDEHAITHSVVAWGLATTRSRSSDPSTRDAYRARVAALITAWRQQHPSITRMSDATGVPVAALESLMKSAVSVGPHMLRDLALAHDTTLPATLVHLADPTSARPERGNTTPDADRITVALCTFGGDVAEDYQAPPPPTPRDL
jgi:hypothetical protein